MNTMNPKVDAYLGRATTWRPEMEKLRSILLDFDLAEELKWGKPCYSLEKSNLFIILALKECCALVFCKGVLLKDAGGVLVQPGENTQGGRWIKFTSLTQIAEMESLTRSYIEEAIEAEKAGLKVPYKDTSEYEMPEELQQSFEQSPALKSAFEALTPGRQRAYLLHFSAAKQSKTRQSRIDKCTPQILNGKGLLD